MLRCPCGGRRRILSEGTEPDAVVAILSHLGLPANRKGGYASWKATYADTGKLREKVFVDRDGARVTPPEEAGER